MMKMGETMRIRAEMMRVVLQRGETRRRRAQMMWRKDVIRRGAGAEMKRKNSNDVEEEGKNNVEEEGNEEGGR